MDIQELNRKGWDRIGQKVASPYMNKEKYSELFNLFCKMLPKKASVLDIGCGPGIPVTKKLAMRGFYVTGVDISGKMIDIAKKNVPNAKFIQMSATDIGFNKKFDGVVASYSMLCLEPESFMKTLLNSSRALKNNGVMFLALNEPAPMGIFKKMLKGVGNLFFHLLSFFFPKKVISGYEKKRHICKIMGNSIYSRPYSVEEIREMLSQIGLKISHLKREIVVSNEYGREHSLIMIIIKK